MKGRPILTWKFNSVSLPFLHCIKIQSGLRGEVSISLPTKGLVIERGTTRVANK